MSNFYQYSANVLSNFETNLKIAISLKLHAMQFNNSFILFPLYFIIYFLHVLFYLKKLGIQRSLKIKYFTNIVI